MQFPLSAMWVIGGIGKSIWQNYFCAREKVQPSHWACQWSTLDYFYKVLEQFGWEKRIKGATGYPRFGWKMLIGVVCICKCWSVAEWSMKVCMCVVCCRAHEHVCGLLEHTFITLFLQTDIVSYVAVYMLLSHTEVIVCILSVLVEWRAVLKVGPIVVELSSWRIAWNC